MDKTLKHITESLEEYKTTHRQVDIGKKRRRLIKDCYKSLKVLEKDSSCIGVRYDRKSVTIRIISHHLLSCSEAPSLLTLVGISDICTIKTCRGSFIIDLELNLWRWVKKEAT